MNLQLSEKALDLINKNKTLKTELALVGKEIGQNRSEQTINRWIKDKNPLLTQSRYIQLIQDATGLADAELFETKTVTA